MRRALRDAVGVLLTVAAVVPAPSVSAKLPLLRRRRPQPPVQTVQYEEGTVLSEADKRLEEIKVELGLLSDIATFAYYLGARAAGETLEVRGYVPNDMVRQRALELARRNTFLTVKDALKIHTNLSIRPPLRPAGVLQQEAAELLQKNLGEPAKHMSVRVRPNGMVVLTGSIDSMEGKLEISRLFRQLSGCFGVINELRVAEMIRDGQRVVAVTQDGSMVVPPAALGMEPGQTELSPSEPAIKMPVVPTPKAEAAPPPLPETPKPAKLPPKKPTAPADQPPRILPPPRPTLPPPTPLPTNSLNAQKKELRLPPTPAPKPAGSQPKSAPKKVGSAPDALITPSQVPVKWGRPARSWESQVKTLEAIHEPPKPRVSGEQAKKSNRRRPGSREKSAPRAHTVTKSSKAPVHVPTRPKPAVAAPALTSSRRWPPAYQTAPPPSKGRLGVVTFDDDPPPPANTGRPGVITFEDEPPPSPKPTRAAATLPALVPANLQRRVQSICGRQARAVTVEVLRDGTALVKVKVPSLSVGDRLTRKIFTIPEMTSPKVRLKMDVGP